jgi:hypothetical protein
MLLEALGSIWQDRPTLDGVPLGDCWLHPAFGTGVGVESGGWVHNPAVSRGDPGRGEASRYVPLHKLSQWLTYSLLEPLMAAGIAVGGVGELTGLAEYRNGGLFVDDGVIVPLVGTRLGLTIAEFPLANVLEGGTWAAGRLIARDKRPDGGPPFQISSDGTVF